MTRGKQIPTLTAAVVLLAAVLSMSCKKSLPEEEAGPEITELKAHSWYYFGSDGPRETDLPQNAPDAAIRPWTEAVRISGAGTCGGTACALVNRLGVLDFSSGRPEFVRDVRLFPGVTADSLLFTPEGPAFHLYRNSHFNTEPGKDVDGKRVLLARYDPERKICVPVLTYEDFGIPRGSQVTSILPKDGGWLAVVKTATAERTNFKYMRFSTPDADGSIPNPEGAAITAQEIDADTFRRAQMPLPFRDAPPLLKSLFSAIPGPFEFYLSCRTDGQAAAVLYDNTELQLPQGGYTSQGCALLFPEKGALAVFSDGTTYITNSLLPGNGGPQGVTVFRLPRLPAGYIYGEVTMHGGILVAGWEETDFYKTGRSGFISVDLGKIAGRIPRP